MASIKMSCSAAIMCRSSEARTYPHPLTTRSSRCSCALSPTKVQMGAAGSETLTPAGSCRAAAVTGPGPELSQVTHSGAVRSTAAEKDSSFKFIMSSKTLSSISSLAPLTLSTPSRRKASTAYPGMHLSSTSLKATPKVWPKPRSNGSSTIRALWRPVSAKLTGFGLSSSNTDTVLFPTTFKEVQAYCRYYFEYNSTMSCSLISEGSSARSGLLL